MSRYSHAHTAAALRRMMLAGVGISALVAAAAVHAQSIGAETEAQNSELHEIVVTARRRDENLEKVPVAITVFDSDELARRQIDTQSDLQRYTPGLVIRETQNRNQQNYAIRGQSIDAYSGSQPGVLSYINEFQNPVVTASAFYDLSSIQVLKGPQGTLFGRNTTGGAVLLTTTPAKLNDVSGYVDGTFGNYAANKVEGALNVPLGDKLAIRVAAVRDHRDGYVRNLITGRRFGEIDSNSVRVSALWKPNDPFESNIVLQYQRGGGLVDPLLAFSANAPGSTTRDGRPLVATTAAFYGPALDSIAGPGAYAALRAVTPGAPAGGYLDFVQIQRTLGPWKTLDNADLSHHDREFLAVNKSVYKISDDLELKNIIGFSSNRNTDGSDVDGSPFAVINNFLAFENKTFSEEFQLSGTTDSDKLNYIAGIYISTQNSANYQTVVFLNVGPVADPLFGLPQGSVIQGKTRDRTQGIFAQGTYKLDNLADGLSVTAGARYTWEQIHFVEVSGFAPIYPNNVSESTEASDPSWNLGLEYQANPNLLLYVAQRGSWRSAGLNPAAPPVNALATQGGNYFRPERTKDVEVGAKYAARVGNMPVRLNVAAYNQWVDNLQRVIYLQLPSGLSSLTTNLPSTTQFYGVELEGSINPTAWLELGGSYALTKGKYGTANNQTIFGYQFSFDTFADIAEKFGSVFAQIDVPLSGKIGNLYARADVSAQSGQYISNNGRSVAPNTFLPGYALANFKIGVSDVAGTGVSVEAFTKNAFNKQYYSGGVSTASLLGFSTALPGEPRFFGLQLGYRF